MLDDGVPGIKKGFRGPELESIPHLPTAGALFSQTSINQRGKKVKNQYYRNYFQTSLPRSRSFHCPFSYFISLLTQCRLASHRLHWLGKKVSAVGVNRENGPSLMRSYISFRNSSLFQQRPKKTESLDLCPEKKKVPQPNYPPLEYNHCQNSLDQILEWILQCSICWVMAHQEIPGQITHQSIQCLSPAVCSWNTFQLPLIAGVQYIEHSSSRV